MTSVPFDPTGTDVSLDGTWQFAPALGASSAPTAALCEQAGIAEVRMVIQSFATVDTYVDSRLMFTCTDGSFDTRPEALLEHDNFQALWTAVDAGGRTRQQLPAIEILAREATHVTLDPGIFETFDPSGGDVTLDGGWQIRDSDGELVAATAAQCDGLGVSMVRLVLHAESAAGPAFVSSDLTFPCSSGGFDTRPTPLLRSGTYRAEWEALSSSGVSLAARRAFDLDAASGGHVSAPVFEIDTRRADARVVVESAWEQEGAFVSCGRAGVEETSYRLVSSSGAAHEDSGSGPCLAEMRFRHVPFDVYTLELTGTGGDRSWAASCSVRVGSTTTLRTRCLAR